MTPKTQATKAKIDEWNCVKLKASSQQRKNQQNEKDSYRTGENTCKAIFDEIDEVSMSKIYNKLQLSSRKTNNPIENGEKNLNRHFTKEKLRKWPKA